MAESEGRAVTYASIARALPEIEAITSRANGPGGFPTVLSEIVDGLVSTCRDAGLLRDIAALLTERYPPSAEASARLISFAQFHEAPDREAYLQRIDPDLATAVRRIWNQPHPSLKPGSRRRGRGATK
ncbi:MAG: hypothetical protein FJW39_09215 [Acidobacteria bacterium]|nr:hypothetical protein [Acidobacteriota bacterium]